MSLEDHVLNRMAALLVLFFIPFVAPLLAILAICTTDRTLLKSLEDTAVITCETLFILLTGQVCEIVTDKTDA